MRITTKGRYGVTAMLDLALHNGQGPIALMDISQRQGISLSYLEQLFSSLRKKGLVSSVRGPGGGYSLNLEAKDIPVIDVITAVDEKIDVRPCNGRGDCHGDMNCLAHELWCNLSKMIYNFLNGISLGDLLTDRAVREAVERQKNVKGD